MRKSILNVAELVGAPDDAQHQATKRRWFIVETYFSIDGPRSRISGRYETREEAQSELIRLSEIQDASS